MAGRFFKTGKRPGRWPADFSRQAKGRADGRPIFKRQANGLAEGRPILLNKAGRSPAVFLLHKTVVVIVLEMVSVL